jgi:hypothetical protein
MRKATIIVLGAVAAILLAGCAAMPLPAPKGENDCLVVIRTRVENPKLLNVVRNYSFLLSTGGAEKLMPTSPSSSIAFIIGEPNVSFVSNHSNVVASGWTGASVESPMNLRLPYRPGYVVILPLEFIHSLEAWGDSGGSTSHFYTRKISDDEKSKLIDELKARDGIEAWKFEE